MLTLHIRTNHGAAYIDSMQQYEPLTKEQVEALLPGSRVFKYGALARMRALPKRPFVVLYETAPNWGHWVCVLDTPEGIEHFDSYGIIPDNELRWVPHWFAPQSGQDVKRLLSLLCLENLRTGQHINYSAHRLQGLDTSTCGRWCVLRARLAHMTSDQFNEAVHRVCRAMGLTPDELVTKAVPNPP